MHNTHYHHQNIGGNTRGNEGIHLKPGVESSSMRGDLKYPVPRTWIRDCLASSPQVGGKLIYRQDENVLQNKSIGPSAVPA